MSPISPGRFRERRPGCGQVGGRHRHRKYILLGELEELADHDGAMREADAAGPLGNPILDRTSELAQYANKALAHYRW